MKPTILAILMVLGLAACAYAVEPQDEATQEREYSPLEQRCIAKWNIASYVLHNRDKYTEEEMLELLAQDWEDYKQIPHFKYHAYVDMQRLIRDAYRRSGKEYKVSNATKEDIKAFVDYEVQTCLWQGF